MSQDTLKNVQFCTATTHPRLKFPEKTPSSIKSLTIANIHLLSFNHWSRLVFPFKCKPFGNKSTFWCDFGVMRLAEMFKAPWEHYTLWECCKAANGSLEHWGLMQIRQAPQCGIWLPRVGLREVVKHAVYYGPSKQIKQVCNLALSSRSSVTLGK